MIFSSASVAFAARHCVKIILILSFCLLISHLNVHTFRLSIWPCYFLILGMLVYVSLFGHVGKGAQRWIYFIGFEFQPSEAMKLFLPLTIIDTIDRSKQYNCITLMKIILLSAPPILLILKQPDLGTALLVSFITLAALYYTGIPSKWLIYGMIVTITSAPLLWLKMHAYQKKRVLNLIFQDFDPLNSGYHIVQSMIAIGSGGFFGKGYMQGSQVHLNFLPEHKTDFIFAHFAEEFGFVGCLLLISIYMWLVYSLFLIAEEIQDYWSRCVIQVIATYIALGAIVNIGMVIGILPVVGVPLPFISYGGTNFLIFSLAISITLICRSHHYETRAFKSYAG